MDSYSKAICDYASQKDVINSTQQRCLSQTSWDSDAEQNMKTNVNCKELLVNYFIKKLMVIILDLLNIVGDN